MKRNRLPKMHIEWEIKDNNNKLLDKGKMVGHSWVGNLLALISSMFSAWSAGSAGTYFPVPGRSDIIDTTNTARGFYTIGSGGIPLGGNAPSGDLTAGILVGSSDTPVSLGQYNLIQRIEHGTGAGQLQYGAMTVESLVKDSVWTLRLVRTFTNATSSTIVVREFGLFLKIYIPVSPTYASIMLARDVPPSAINIPAGSTLTIRYVISMSVS